MTRDRESESVASLTLDTGALVAFERGSPRMRALVDEARRRHALLVIPICVVAQAWRDGATQTRLASLLKSDLVRFAGLDLATAKAAGELCGRRATADVVDALVVLVARRHGRVVATSDPGDLRRLDPELRVVAVD